MMRLADSEAFELLLVNYMNNPCISEESKYLLSVVLDMAKANPTVDAVKVVRCKDCKHYLGLAECKMMGFCGGTNFYCGWAERRESEGETDADT